MVAIKSLLLVGLSLTGVITRSIPSAQNLEARDVVSDLSQEDEQLTAVEKRSPGRMTLQWDTAGVMFFNVGLQLPGTVTQLVSASTDIAKQLTEDFLVANFNRIVHLPVQAGGVSGLYSTNAQGLYSYGIGIVMNSGVSAADINTMKNLLISFGQQHSGVVQVIQVARGVLNPESIGYTSNARKERRDENENENDTTSALEARTRGDYCPTASMDLIQYAMTTAPYIYDLRWVPTCPSSQQP